MLRRDGFSSMHASKNGGTLITDVIKCEGKHLFVNVDLKDKKGKLEVELLNSKGEVIKGFSKNECVTLRSIDNTKQIIEWKSKSDLADLKDEYIQIKFYLSGGDLYSFWISEFKTGESGGYTAGGGPDLNNKGIDIK